MDNCPKAALFDLDETLAPTLLPPSESITRKLLALLERIPVAILTGRYFEEIQPVFLATLADSPHAERMFILASGASKGYEIQNGGWMACYSFELRPDEIARLRAIVEEVAVQTHALDGLPSFGEYFVDKGTMLSFALLGASAPAELRRSWDPGNVRRHALQEALETELPEYDILMGGLSSLDISRKGINKAYGVRWISERLHIPPEDMLYIGDALYEGGNDAVVTETGIPVCETTGPERTAQIIDELLNMCSKS